MDNITNHNPLNLFGKQVKDTENPSNLKTLDEAIQHDFYTLKNSEDIRGLIEDARINPFEELQKPPSILEYNGVPFGTLGNFSVLNGRAKSRKSFFATILATVVMDNYNISYRGFKNNAPNTHVTYFDTEQSNYHVNRLGNRIVRKLQLERDNNKFSIYTLRKHSPAMRLKIIEEILYNSKQNSLVVIDGIADLISNGYNDETDAIMIVSKLLKWTQELNIHILVIVHQNKGDTNAKGHLGSQLMQKAETVIDIIRLNDNKDISVAKASLSRGIDIDDIYFSIDESGIAELTDSATLNKKVKSKKPIDFEENYKLSLINKVFAQNNELIYSDLLKGIKMCLAEDGHEVGDSYIKLWLNYFKELHIVIQNGLRKGYQLNSKFKN